ncbi:MAG: cytochrome c peroxidase [Deltaproteobacteria bacterium]|nr:cytochrome c peroxidase [Desulfitobacteriaceae bacterium]MDI6854615.1 cytochrome c peroxidase [Deltaproteobacteria bacterium]
MFNSLARRKICSVLLVPIIVGLIFMGAPMNAAWAKPPEGKGPNPAPLPGPDQSPAYPIQTPADARSWGLDSLGNLMRSGHYNSGTNVQPLVLNKDFKVPMPFNLGDFVKNREAALVLGKALFWDMQVGSDGIQACATCHFQAGSDIRTKNQVSTAGEQVKYERAAPWEFEGDNFDIIGFFNAPKTGSDAYETIDDRTWGDNFQLEGIDFPQVITQNAFIEEDNIIKADAAAKNRNDVVGSMGLMTGKFAGVTPGHPVDIYDQTIGLGTMRQRTGRNAPPSVNAVFNLLQFWDGRADSKFNGFNPIGRHDLSSPKYFVNVKGKLKERILNMNVASLASQSTGPPLSDVEMSFADRKWPDIGKKLTGASMKPLAYQKVSKTDSVLGSLVVESSSGSGFGYGLNTTYKALVQAAFKDELWSVSGQALKFPQAKVVPTTQDEQIFIQGPYEIVTLSKGSATLPDGYTQMEANFSLFWGIAIMLYEAELVSPKSRFDKWMEGEINLTDAELDGLNVFVGAGKCIACHSGPEFTNATVRNTRNGAEQIEPIIKQNGDPAFYDNGFYNIGITPTVDDIQRGAKDPNGNPWGNARQFLFQYTGYMNIPFTILGLPITTVTEGYCTEELLNGKCINGEFVKQSGTDQLFAFATDPTLEPTRGVYFLVCNDKNGDKKCGLEDDIAIKTLDQDGNGKACTVRNIELNGPYFHNGGAATLQQLLDEYDIGGKFNKDNLNKVDMLPDITRLNLATASTPKGTNAEEALVSFMLALTDPDVKKEAKPFDHPQLFIPVDGEAEILDATDYDTNPAAPNAWLASNTKFQELPATGAGGGVDLNTFLGLDPFDGDTGKGGIVEDSSS